MHSGWRAPPSLLEPLFANVIFSVYRVRTARTRIKLESVTYAVVGVFYVPADNGVASPSTDAGPCRCGFPPSIMLKMALTRRSRHRETGKGFLHKTAGPRKHWPGIEHPRQNRGDVRSRLLARVGFVGRPLLYYLFPNPYAVSEPSVVDVILAAGPNKVSLWRLFVRTMDAYGCSC
jgi:hypothetical protein